MPALPGMSVSAGRAAFVVMNKRQPEQFTPGDKRKKANMPANMNKDVWLRCVREAELRYDRIERGEEQPTEPYQKGDAAAREGKGGTEGPNPYGRQGRDGYAEKWRELWGRHPTWREQEWATENGMENMRNYWAEIFLATVPGEDGGEPGPGASDVDGSMSRRGSGAASTGPAPEVTEQELEPCSTSVLHCGFFFHPIKSMFPDVLRLTRPFGRTVGRATRMTTSRKRVWRRRLYHA